MTGRQKSPGKEVRRPVWAEVSLGALAHNLNAIRKYVNPPEEKRKTPRKILSIVKGNGYGHGGPEVAKALEKFGADWFGVASAGEGMELRKAGVRKPILVLGGFWPGEEKNLIHHNLTPAIHCCAQLLAKCKRLELTGTFTHLAASEVFTDTPTGHETPEQLERLFGAIDR